MKNVRYGSLTVFLFFLASLPCFPQPHPDDIFWDNRFGISGLLPIKEYSSSMNVAVRALAAEGVDLYVGGQFAGVGNNIARWSTLTNTWAALGSGIEGSASKDTKVNVIVVNGTDMYVGGRFTRAGGVEVKNIARWNTVSQQWYSLGEGISGEVNAIAVQGNTVYAGGRFSIAGAIGANNIAQWDGQVWSSLGKGGTNGVDGGINALAVFDGDLYAGGEFSSAGGDTTFSTLVKWKGTQWQSLGGFSPTQYSFSGTVTCLAVSAKGLYVGGAFDSIGTVAATGAARWNGSAWEALATDMGVGAGGVGGYPSCMVSDGGDVFIGGMISSVDHILANGIARLEYSSHSWQALGSGIGSSTSFVQPMAVALLNGKVFVGGNFDKAGSIVVNNIAGYEQQTKQWFSLAGAGANGISGQMGGALQGEIAAMATNGSDLYIAGSFTHAGNTTVNGVAWWDGALWHNLASGFSQGYGYPSHAQTSATGLLGLVACAVGGNNVYVGGGFYTVGTDSVNNIARFDGAKWLPLGNGITVSRAPNQQASTFYLPSVHALTVAGSDLYVGGDFARAGSVAANSIARWDGANWYPLGSGVDAPGAYNAPIVSAIAVENGIVVVGGSFTQAGGIAANKIARWDGQQWSALGSGMGNGSVQAVVIAGSDIYAAGSFKIAGGKIVNNIARWNGSEWLDLNGGVQGNINALVIRNDKLYAAGIFQTVGGIIARNVAVWDIKTQQWSVMGSGVGTTPSVVPYPQVLTAAVVGDGLYFGGNFTEAGATPSFGIARWDLKSTDVLMPEEPDSQTAQLRGYPNPLTMSAHLAFTIPSATHVILGIYDALGNKIITLLDARMPVGAHDVVWETGDIPDGVYYCRLQYGETIKTSVLVLTR